MKRNVLISIATVLLLVAITAAFYYMRPSVCILTDEVPYSFFRHVDTPKHMTMSYRTTWRTKENLERLSRYDMVIDMTLDGVEPQDNVYRMGYSTKELFLPYVESLNDGNIYILYDLSSDDEVEFADLASMMNPNVELISYDYRCDRASYAIMEDEIVEGSYLMVLNLSGCMDFIRYIDKDVVLVVDYLDAAALDDGADIVASPDWDSMIRGFLSI